MIRTESGSGLEATRQQQSESGRLADLAPDARLPDTAILETCLRAVLRDSQPEAGDLIGIERRPNVYTSSAPAEIVTCRFASGNKLQLLLKYDRPDRSADDGHWGSVGHEIQVYRELLRPLPARVARYYGRFTVAATGQRCLVLLWLDGALRLTHTVETRTAMTLAAQWIGQFHAAAEARLLEASVQFLDAYDSQYYARWARQACEYTRMLHESYPWLSVLCARFEEACSELARGPLTVIHGEYYPKNILLRDGLVYPVDWQSTAIARGEVDLASLTDGGWGQEIEALCEEAYQRSRWGDEAPGDFHRTLALARVYWPLRWLGAHPRVASRQGRQWYVDSLRIQGERAGLL